eukprot:754289-Hanusia_phi.AAC.2
MDACCAVASSGVSGLMDPVQAGERGGGSMAASQVAQVWHAEATRLTSPCSAMTRESGPGPATCTSESRTFGQ